MMKLYPLRGQCPWSSTDTLEKKKQSSARSFATILNFWIRMEAGD
jgi:hypothetical protein